VLGFVVKAMNDPSGEAAIAAERWDGASQLFWGGIVQQSSIRRNWA